MSGLIVSHLSFNYGSKQALQDVSFEVETGRFCALLGPNGAGKTTLFALLTRLFLPSEGHIRIAGIDLSKEPRKALAKMGVVFQQQTLDLDLSVRSNLFYYAALHGISGRRAAKRIDAALDRLGMRERAGEKARNLNGGHRRRMEIARALIHQPTLLLLDEATVGLDVATRMAITAHVHSLCRDDGLTALWATHLVDEVEPDDDLIVLNHGRIVAQGRVDDVSGETRLADKFAELTEQEAAL
jgi:ABC-2 type transport system ATP-binding protein